MQRANDQLRVMVEEDPQLEGMGTTLTALLWTGQRLGLVHVGDSRAYLLRDGVLTQITQDHTWVQRLVDEGRITEEEATTHPQRSLLMRALGSGDHVEPDLSIREVRAGDRYLICSDGLSGVVSHQTMEETLASYQGPQETVQELIQLALRGGGPDNITCIVADVLDIDTGDTLAGQLNDTPVVVGAVAENQHQLQRRRRHADPRRPRRRPRPPVPPHGGRRRFGPPGSGDATGYGCRPTGGFGATPTTTSSSRAGGRKWLKRSFYIVLALGRHRRRPVRRLPLDADPVLRRRQGRARRALPGHQPGPGLGLALEGREGPPRDRTQVPPALPAKQVEATIAEGGLTDARDEDRRARRRRRPPARRTPSAARRPSAAIRQDRRGRGRRHHGNHTDLRRVQGDTDTDPTPTSPTSPTADPRPHPLPRPAPASRRKSRSWSRCAVSSRQAVEGPCHTMSSTTNPSTHHTSTIGAIGAPSRRNTELALLVFAVVIPVFAYANVGLAINDEVPPGLLGYGLGLGLLAGVGHLVVRKFAPYADPLLLPLATLLNGLGLVAIWRLDQSERLQRANDVRRGRRPRQLLYSALGIALFVGRADLPQGPPHPAALHLHLHGRRPGPAAPAAGPRPRRERQRRQDLDQHPRPRHHPARRVREDRHRGLLRRLPDGEARRPGPRQPPLHGPVPAARPRPRPDPRRLGDLDPHPGLRDRPRHLAAVLRHVRHHAVRRHRADQLDRLRSADVRGRRGRRRHLRAARPAACPGLARPVARVPAQPRRDLRRRLHTEQAMQALWAFGSGGTLGTGLGQGNSDLIGFAANSDFILATFGEELGLAGVMAFLLIYGLIVERGVRTALAARDPFGKLLAIGLSGAFALQVFVVAGGVMGLIPLTGMTMPFLAYGGSSVIANWALIGILIRISDTARRPAPAPAPNPDAEMTQVVRP